jgi:cellobiose-specific phosphotransferase system component IIC
MKAFKSIEFFLQAGLLLLTLLAAIMDEPEMLNPIVFGVAFITVQITSIFVNLAAGRQYWKKAQWRKFHLIGIALVLSLIVVAVVQDSAGSTGDKDDKYSMAGLGTLLYATIPATLLSLFYVVITFFEWKKLQVKK